MSFTNVTLRLSDELVEKVNAAAEILQKNRTEIIKEALQEYLQKGEDDEKFREAVIELYLDDDISFEVLKEFIGRQNAESVQASKKMLETGEELSQNLAEI